jgi:hypothetical protein
LEAFLLENILSLLLCIIAKVVYLSGKSGELLLLSPPGTVLESFPSYGSSVFKPFLYQASVCITDFVILDNSPLTLLSVSLSPIGVFEYLTFVSLFPFTQENTISKSASFRSRAKLEPLSNPLQIDIRFFTESSTLFVIVAPYEVSTLLKGTNRAYQVLRHE